MSKEGNVEEPETIEPEGKAAEKSDSAGKEPAAKEPESKDPEEDLTDKHGQEAVAKGRYDRDMQAKDDEIGVLKKQIEESSKTEAGRKALEDKIEALEGTQTEMRTEYELKLAGCRDEKALKAAKTLIGDYEGDVSKLKAECPYLFAEEKQKGKTGFKPAGAAGDLDDKLDKAFGIKN
ncbi:MAG: hypothetical protein RR178_07095 [Gordonibacter sp.]